MSDIRQAAREEARMDGLSIHIAEGTPSVFHVAGDLDLATAGRFGAALQQALSADSTLVLDLAEVTFVDAAGLRAILQAAQCRDGEGPLTLVNASRVVRLLEVVGLEGLPSIELRDGDAERGR
jgi:anti-anti-sigma factor